MKNQKLEELKVTIANFITNNDEVEESEAAEISVKLIYYLYAYYHNIENIVEGFRKYIDTKFADQLIEILNEQFPDVVEFIKEVTSKEFDAWYENYK